MVYLSLGSISLSVGISAFQRSSARSVVAVFADCPSAALALGEADDSDVDAANPEDESVVAAAALVRLLRAKARSTVATTASTARRRLRCRAFCGRERRHGIFLRGGVRACWVEREGTAYQSSPPNNGDVALNGPSMAALAGQHWCCRNRAVVESYRSKLRLEISRLRKAVRFCRRHQHPTPEDLGASTTSQFYST